MRVLGTPIKAKKAAVEEDVAGCWNAPWAASCLRLDHSLHTLFVCLFVCALGPYTMLATTACVSNTKRETLPWRPHRWSARAAHAWFVSYQLYTDRKLTQTRAMVQGSAITVGTMIGFFSNTTWILVLQCSIFPQFCKTFLKCLYITSCSSAECKITSWHLL